MKKIDMLLHFRLYLFELEAQDAKRSTGSNGKLADSVLRYGSLKNGYSRLSDIPCRARGPGSSWRRRDCCRVRRPPAFRPLRRRGAC